MARKKIIVRKQIVRKRTGAGEEETDESKYIKVGRSYLQRLWRKDISGDLLELSEVDLSETIEALHIRLLRCEDLTSNLK